MANRKTTFPKKRNPNPNPGEATLISGQPPSTECLLWISTDIRQHFLQQPIASQTRLKDVLRAWQDANRIRLKGSTVSRYQNLIDTHILPELGNFTMQMLTPSVLNQFILNKMQSGRTDNQGGLSSTYVRSIAQVIDSAIRFGASQQLCEPLKTDLLKPAVNKKEIVVLSKAIQTELETVLLTEMTAEKLLTYITLYTGMRIGEVLALRWEDIDFSGRILYVRHTIARVWQEKDGIKHSVLIVAEPKTPSSKRIIPLCSRLYDVLVHFPGRRQTGYLLAYQGSFVSPRTFEYRYKRILRESGIAQVNYHALRHTFATRCIEADVDVKSLSKILGHANASVTLNIYVHSSIEQQRRQLEKIV